MTGTPFCMLPVTGVNDLPIGNGQVGPVFERLLARWSENVGIDIGGQIKAWAADIAGSPAYGAPTPYAFRPRR